MELLSPAKATAVAGRIADRLATMARSDGGFLYRYMLPAPEVRDEATNALRHILSVSALIEAEAALGPRAGLAAAIDGTAGFVLRSLQPFGGPERLVVVDDGFIKTGGNGLAIALAVAMAARTGDGGWVETAGRLGRYLLDQRLPDGEFFHMRLFGPVAAVYPKRSAFFTGQALFGLARLHQATGDPGWLEPALESAVRLARPGSGAASHSHWLLIGLEALHRCRPELALAEFAGRVAAPMIANPAHRVTGEVTALACQAEGLLAFARMTGEGEAVKVVRADLRAALGLVDVSGAVISSRQKPEVRIDYMAHLISALLGYAHLVAGKPGPRR